MKIRLIFVVTIFSLLVAGCSQPPLMARGDNTEKTKQKPNVLLIMVDDYRVAMGAMGDKRAITPNLDKLAAQGMLFTRAYANVPVCGASRASMMTSVYPHKTRFIDYLANAEREVPEATTMGELFKNEGYYTISNGKVFHSRKDSDEKSWTEPAWEPKTKGPAYFSDDSKNYVKPSARFGDKGPWYESAEQADEVYYDGQVKQKTVSDLKRLAKLKKPFFLAAGFRRPHLPFNAPQKYFDLYKNTDFQPSPIREKPQNAPESLKGSGEIHVYHFKNKEYNSDEFHRLSLLGYYAAVSFIDQQVGDLLSTLDELSLRDNTIVVLTSDHGFNLGEHNFWGKHNMLNKALHIPLIIDAPKHKAGGTTDALVTLVDIFPTMIELAGLNTSAKLDQQIVGKSMAPLLKDPKADHTPFVYSRFKQGDTLISKHLIYTEYVSDTGKEESMLYDLQRDPEETFNVVSDPNYRKDVVRFSDQLKQIKAKVKRIYPISKSIRTVYEKI
ncbi:sulfatase [Paraglaciecola aquimarina]|uniref:Sulfatase n=1 Tax=Paraglaciecola aquimarina TaxID=1235557 RepID=A0ABU3SR97_9ALTE|nr:sulfatase [Paraglaciecola aquimarina]MDU0352525.1 sulfatase [Paraglaciecola aquimarina]